MHVHILTKLFDQKGGDCDKHTMPLRDAHVSIKLCIGDAVDIGSQVDVNSQTDACTHSEQGV